jgi:hypothetical protein
VVNGALWALESTEAGSTLIVRRTDVIGARVYGAIAVRGSIDLENSRMTIVDGTGIYTSAGADQSAVHADHVTILNGGLSSPAIDLEKTSGAADTTVTVSNSILRGFSSGYKVNAAAGPGIGHAELEVSYSNFPKTGANSGLLDIATGNIDADPMLNADLSLPPGSPSIDAGDPGAGLTTDFLGNFRPRDGNGDGVAVRDQGAFEYQPPKPPSKEVEEKDITPPNTKISKGPGKALARGKVKFAFSSTEQGPTFACKLDRKKTIGCKSPRRYGHLKLGRHTFKVWAIDAAGNKDPTPAKRSFRVPAAGQPSGLADAGADPVEVATAAGEDLLRAQVRCTSVAVAWARGLTTISSMLTWGGRETAQRMHSATSSARSGSIPA